MRLLLALFAALLVLPLAAEGFYLQFATRIMIMALFAVSLDLLVGHAGLVSLGHALFFGLGAYALMLLSPQAAAASLPLSLGAAALVAGGAALVVGALVLRTSGVYFIMVTLAFGQMAYFAVHDSRHLGGSDGKYIYVRPVLELFGWKPFDLERPLHFYYFAFVLLAAAFILIRVLLASPFGRVIAGIKENEHRMRAVGYPTYRYKLVCFVIAGAIAGAAGWLAAALDGVVNPEMLSWHQSGQLLMMVILGGSGTVAGPLLGAGAFKLLELVLQGWTKHWQLALGGLIILAVLLLPRGLAQLFPRFTAPWKLRPLFARKA